MPLWLIPMIYVGGALIFGIVFLRLEHDYLAQHSVVLSQWFFNNFSIASAQACLGAVAAGMIALTAIVFTVAYITAQFNAVAYSPRVALLLLRRPSLFHTFGLFNATFIYSLITMGWVDRDNSQIVPKISMLIVVIMVIASMFAFARLVRGVSDLLITKTLQAVGDEGRIAVHNTLDRLETNPPSNGNTPAVDLRDSPVSQTLRYMGVPRSIVKFDRKLLIALARQFDALIEMDCAVGDTIVYDTKLLQIRGASQQVPDKHLWRGIHLSEERSFDEDPKYAMRLLVDIAIKALSPAINDPTTAVQAIDQLEDLLHRLGRRNLEDVYAQDRDGIVRLIYPTPSWEDFLRLSFDEIRQFGAGSVQVMRRLRSALVSVAETLSDESRIAAVERYLNQLDLVISRSPLDPEDRAVAGQQDRQGLGVSRPGPTLQVVSGNIVA
jgi:uncharacterized membrane protein